MITTQFSGRYSSVFRGSIGKLGHYSQGGLKEYNTIVTLGASIMQQSFSNEADVEARFLAAYGKSITFDQQGVSGHDAQQTLSRLTGTVLPLYAGQTDVLFCIHTGGNNVSATRPYSTATQGELDALENALIGICDALDAAGHDYVLTELTFRDYLSNYTVEADGSLPYNQNIHRPLIQARCPQWLDAEGKPIWQLYEFFRGYSALYLELDGVHPSAAGEAAMRQFLVDTVGKVIFTGVVPTEEQRLPTLFDGDLSDTINEGDSLVVSGSVSFNGRLIAADTPLEMVPQTGQPSVLGHGTYDVDASGNYTYTLDPDYFVTAPPSSIVQDTINLAVTNGDVAPVSITLNAGGPGSGVVKFAFGNTTAGPLFDGEGDSLTLIRVNLSAVFEGAKAYTDGTVHSYTISPGADGVQGANTQGTTTGDDTGVQTDALLAQSTFTGSVDKIASVILSGLIDGNDYELRCSASRTGSGTRRTRFSIDGGPTQEINAFGNTSQEAVFTFTAGPSGQIDLRFETPDDFAYLNYIVLTEL